MEALAVEGATRRRIIKRPRLTRMLDESGARIILLVAPAGYGKTTLAHEWLDEKRAAWYRCGPAAADVAALAVGLAAAAAEIVPGAGDRMRQRLRATNRPEEDAAILAEMLAEDLTEWPEDAWLAIDDYHYAMEASAPDEFMGVLTAATPISLVVGSRRRPAWARARMRIYGNLLELDRTALAMSNDEALDVLAQRGAATSWVGQAAGWPAVIGLAALTAKASLPPSQPSALYDYFAEELLQEIEPSIRLALCRLAVAPSITADCAVHLLGEETARHVLNELAASGTLSLTVEGRYELHPLLQTFLQDRLQDFGSDAAASAVERVGEYLLQTRQWDDALFLAQRFPDSIFLEALIENSWEVMLDEGRLATLSGLLELASELRLRAPILDLVEAEVAFRQGLYRKAEVLSLEATRSLRESHLLVRAFTRAGQSAHFEGREDEALHHHRSAQSIAELRADQREALWGEFVCSMELESSDSLSVLERLEELGLDDPKDAVRVAAGQMLVAIRQGEAVADDVVSAVHRLPRVDDPLIRSSFLHVWACVLTMRGRYAEALEATQQQLGEVEQYRLAFVRPHALVRKAVALRGLRKFAEALECLSEAERGRTPGEDHTSIAVRTVRLGLHLSKGDVKAALGIREPLESASAAPNVIAELIATRALALACAGQHEDAAKAVAHSGSLSSAAEPRLLGKLALAITALSAKSTDATEFVGDALTEVAQSGNVDAFVTAYRGFPQLLEEAGRSELESDLRGILKSARDEKLAHQFSDFEVSEHGSLSTLTKREHEVLDLMALGLRNREIAEKLFVAEVTVKVHVRNILRKVGARTRTEAVSIVNRLN